MIDSYIDSVLPAFSDDEDFEVPSIVSKVRIDNRLPSVQTVVVAANPASASVSHFVELSERQPIYACDSEVGFAAFANGVGFVCLKKEVIFDISALFEETKGVIILQSRQGSSQGVRVLSTTSDDNLVKFEAINNPVGGIGAYLLTKARMESKKCTVLLCEHKSIRIDLDCIMNLFDAVSKLADLPQAPREVIVREFRKIVPINSKVPLYT